MRITIGIPFYNNKHTLANAIRSVFAQTLQDWELILVDDGSNDGSLEIAREVDDPRVRVISDGINKGLPFRLNQIAQVAQGEYIARMDADDLMHPERLASQAWYLDAHPAVDLVGTATYTIDDVNNPVGVRGLGTLNVSSKAVLKHGLMIHPTVTGRTIWFRRNPYDSSFPRAEDRELWCRTCQNSAFAKFSEPLYFYREGPVINTNNYRQSCRTDRKIFKKYGPSTVGWPTTMTLILRSHTKDRLYRIFTAFNAQSALIRMRNSPLREKQRADALEIINNILETPVPGLTFDRAA